MRRIYSGLAYHDPERPLSSDQFEAFVDSMAGWFDNVPASLATVPRLPRIPRPEGGFDVVLRSVLSRYTPGQLEKPIPIPQWEWIRPVLDTPTPFVRVPVVAEDAVGATLRLRLNNGRGIDSIRYSRGARTSSARFPGTVIDLRFCPKPQVTTDIAGTAPYCGEHPTWGTMQGMITPVASMISTIIERKFHP